MYRASTAVVSAPSAPLTAARDVVLAALSRRYRCLAHSINLSRECKPSARSGRCLHPLTPRKPHFQQRPSSDRRMFPEVLWRIDLIEISATNTDLDVLEADTVPDQRIALIFNCSDRFARVFPKKTPAALGRYPASTSIQTMPVRGRASPGPECAGLDRVNGAAGQRSVPNPARFARPQPGYSRRSTKALHRSLPAPRRQRSARSSSVLRPQ